MSFSSVLLVLLSLLPVVDQAATFVVNVTQSSYEAKENQSITLEWTFTSRTQGSYRDLFIYCSLLAPHRELVLYKVHGGVEFPESQDEQFSGRVQIDKVVLREGRIRLHVSRLRTEDSGQYGCEVETEDGFGSETCRLNVLDENGAKGDLTDPEDGNEENNKGWKIGLDVGISVIIIIIIIIIFIAGLCYLQHKQNQRRLNRRGGEQEAPEPEDQIRRPMAVMLLKKVFPSRSNKSQHEQGRNDGDCGGNEKSGDEAEREPLQNQGQPNQSV